MRTICLIRLLGILSFPCSIYGQSKIDCNTLFICIAKDDYEKLFENSFVKDTLFLCRESSTKTTTDAYTGKYFIGEFATIEFFQPSESNNFGNKLDDTGLEFKTNKVGDLNAIKNKTSAGVCQIDDTYFDNVSQKVAWYKALKIIKQPANFEISILEYSREYLEELGFTKKEISKTISLEQYNKVVYQNKKYPRKFQSIRSIEVEINQDGKNYLKQVAKQFGFKITKNTIVCNGFKIFYKLNKSLQKVTLKNIEINLNEKLATKQILISPTISLSIINKKARINFN